ncbi:MAG: hypothetical protein IKU29_02945 [Parabacteroides sp.]|nr:hypothetical protein [Parabacteroides sp.]
MMVLHIGHEPMMKLIWGTQEAHNLSSTGCDYREGVSLKENGGKSNCTSDNTDMTKREIQDLNL